MNLCVAGFLGSSGNNLLVKQLVENGYIFVENTFAKNRPQLDEKGNLLEVKEWDGVYR